jgi:PAS domain S-box-containing protein
VSKVEREIAELRARTAELERDRELLNAIANTAPSLLCVIDRTGRVRDRATNIAFERMLRYDPSETGGVLFWERYVPPEDADEARAAIEDVLDGGEPRERDGRWLTRDGEVLHVAWSCTPLPEIADGRLYLISATDIGERRHHAEEMRRSRARIVAAADDARKRLERNLHDGAQQRLVSVSHFLSLARRRLDAGDDGVRALVESASEQLALAHDELREVARGIHPAALEAGGLRGALLALADRSPVPVQVSVPDARLPGSIEIALYYVVAEALTNVAKYAQAESATVEVLLRDGQVEAEIADDGVGGADPAAGSGLRGLADRVEALDGRLELDSLAGAGTRVRAIVPLS